MSRSRHIRIALAATVAGGAALALVPSPAWAADETATLIATHSTATWAVPSPDPAGITYDPVHGRLVISDSEVDETPLYNGINVYFSTLRGAQSSSNVGWTTEPWSFEPTGISQVTPGLSVVSDDDADRVFGVSTDSSGRPIGTPASFTTRPNNGDAEDATVTTKDRHVVTVDGVNKALYDYGPGPDGVFDGVAPAGDDTRITIDLSQYGALNPEGVTYYAQRNAVLVVDNDSKAVYELGRSGLINKIDISVAAPRHAAGITLAPASDGSGRLDMYIVDRGVDNNTNPSENDGRLYEVRANL
jgi:hypothetical protein